MIKSLTKKRSRRQESAYECEGGFRVLIVDSDTAYLKRASEIVAEAGHSSTTARDLVTTFKLLSQEVPHVLVVEAALLQSDSANPLDEIRREAPAAPIIITAPGPPDERPWLLARSRDFCGYHDKREGLDGLLLWVNAAITTARHMQLSQKTRQGLRYVLEAIPHLQKVQTLDDVLEGILWQIEGLVGGESSFLAARLSGSQVESDVEGFIAFPRSSDDYVVRAATGRHRCGLPVSRLDSVPTELIRSAVENCRSVIEADCSIFPLALGDQVLGVAYLDKPPTREQDIELLQLFSSQAATAIQKATLYELATVDSTTHVLLKSYALERLAETLKLALRQRFPVALLMVDADGFKRINDERGQVVGDRTLRYVAHVIKRTVRDSDIVGRFGGDEFVVVLVDSDLHGAEVVADRLHKTLAKDANARPDDVPPVQVSVGIASLEPGEATLTQLAGVNLEAVMSSLIAEADRAMCEAKGKEQPTAVGQALMWPIIAALKS